MIGAGRRRGAVGAEIFHNLAAGGFTGRAVPVNPHVFRHDTRWAVYVATDGRARLTVVELGHQTGQEAEVTSGLSEGTMVIVHPGDLLRDGARITERARR